MSDAVAPIPSIVIDGCVEEILRVFTKFGAADYIGEAINQTQHGLQCAALATAAKAPPEVILASLFHDVGHMTGLETGASKMGDLGIANHEQLGADLLKKLGFPELTYTLVLRHVDAKRYQCAINRAYYEKLSDASKGTLAFQGGPMSEDEVKKFDLDPLKRWILLMRSWDEKAKVKDLKVADMESYIPMMKEVIRNNLQQKSNE